ncbi:MAG: hypothetical protein NZ923_03505 [Candidatus Kryptonium sp.]|nr:hypothetical protein [Candidatus Kryptonium sp.]
MRVLLAYFSFTGNTEKVSLEILKHLQASGVKCDVFKIEPLINLKYPFWLFLSFVPSLPFPVKNLNSLNLKDYNALILGSPKWTFNCPPITYFIHFLKRLGFGNSFKIFLFLTYGGFREDVYLKKLKIKLEKIGFDVPIVWKFKRRKIQEGKVDAEIQKFCSEILASINPSDSNISKP